MKFFNKKAIMADAADESGAGTTFAIFISIVCLAIGGLAIDASNAWSTKSRLESATDIAAHAAIVKLVYPTSLDSHLTTSDTAIAALLTNMPDSIYGTALQASDVVEGYWDPTLVRMSALNVGAGGEPLLKAVSVTSRLDGQVGNVVPTFVLKIIGFNYWKISATSVYVRDTPICYNGGFIANGQVDISSNNNFIDGFCIHGNNGVDVNSSVHFGNGVRVSMPDSRLVGDGTGMFDLKGTNHTWANGMPNQLVDHYLPPSLATAASLNATLASLSDPADPGRPAYIINPTVQNITLRGSDILTAADVIPGAVHVIDCPNSGLDFEDNLVLQNVIIVADCKVNFGANTSAMNAIIATSNTGNQSFNSSSSMNLGFPDNCAPGGGVSLFTLGEAHFSASTVWNGVELFALDDVHISANANGLNGVHVETNGDIKATSNLGFGGCNGGVDHYAEFNIVRMVY